MILTREDYTNKAGCENGIASVRENAINDDQFERKTSTNNKPYFNLKAKNGQIIGPSEMYESIATRNTGIESVKNNAPLASVEDNG